MLPAINWSVSLNRASRRSNWNNRAWLLKRQEGAGFYDRFRGRLMFPIHNESGKVIGFGGRALRPGEEPKYLNSPETALYRKSYVVYNLHRAKDAIRNVRTIPCWWKATWTSSASIRRAFIMSWPVAAPRSPTRRCARSSATPTASW